MRRSRVTGVAPAAKNGARSAWSWEDVPKNWPLEPTRVAPESVASTESSEKSSSGAFGAQRCQASTTRAASDQDHPARKIVAVLTGWVVNVNRVATPKFPPPPPRQAQNRSGFRCGLHCLTTPSAVTIVKLRRLSQVRPSLRPANPTPPPRARPAMPTEGHDPAGIVTPRAASSR